MPEVTPPAATGTPTPTPPVGTGTTTPTTPEYATKEDIAELARQVGQANKAAREALAKFATPPAPAKNPEDATLTEQVKGIQEEKKLIRRQQQFGAIEKALKANGVLESQSERFAKLILNEEEERLEQDNSDPLIPKILYKESDEKKTPLSEWVKAYLETSKGSWMKPPKATAKIKGLEIESTDDPYRATGWTPKTQQEAMAQPNRYQAWISIAGNREVMASLPRK